MEGVGGDFFACEPEPAPPPARIIKGRDPQKNVFILIRKAENIFLRGTRAERAAAEPSFITNF